MARLGLADFVREQSGPLEIEITPLRPSDVSGKGGSPAVGFDPMGMAQLVDTLKPKTAAPDPLAGDEIAAPAPAGEDPLAGDEVVDGGPETMEGVVLQLLGGLNEKAGDLPQALMTLSVMSQNPKLARPLFEAGEIPHLVDIVGRVAKPKTPAERVARRAGETLGMTLPATGMLTSLAGAGLKAQQGAGAVAQGLEALLDGIKATPAMTAFWDVLASVGAGVGGGIANEIYPGSAGAEVAGDLAGSMAPAATRLAPVSLLGRTGHWLWSRFASPTARKQRSTELAAEVVQKAMTPAAQAELARTQGIRQEVGPDFKPGLAEATGSPQLMATQRSVEAQASGAELDMLVGRKLANVEAVRRYADGAGPQDLGDVPFVVDAAGGRISMIREDIAKRAGEAAAKRRGVAERLETVDRPGTGRTIRERIAKLRHAASDDLSRMATSLGLLSQKGDFAPYQQSVEGIRLAASGFDQKSPGAPKIIKRILDFGGEKKGGPVDISFGQAKQLREELVDDILTESGSAAPNRKALRVLIGLRNGLDDWMETQFSGVAGYKEFRQKYLTEFIQRFERGAVFRARKFRAQGDYMTADEKVGEAFLKAGDEAAAKQISDLSAKDPALRTALHDVWFDKLRAYAVRDGVLDPKRTETFLRQHESVLKYFPVERATMSVMASADEALRVRAGALEARARLIESRALTRMLPTETRQGRTPDEIMDAAMKDPRLMAQLERSTRGTPARPALSRAVWDRALDQAGDGMLNVSHLRDYLRKHAPSINAALSPSHVRALDTTLSALEVALRTPIPIGAPEELNLIAQLQRKLNVNPMQVSSRVVNIESGRLSGKVAGFDAIARWFAAADSRQSSAMLKEALFDERVAQTLASMTKAPTVTPAQRKKLGGYLLEIGLPHQIEGGNDAERRE